MKHWRGMNVAELHSRGKNAGVLFTGDDAIMTEQRGAFLANSLPGEITVKGGNRQFHTGSRLMSGNLPSVALRISTQRSSSLLM